MITRPCPFCAGNDLTTAPTRATTGKSSRWVVYCNTCGAEGPPANDYEGAIMRWSIRIVRTSFTATIER